MQTDFLRLDHLTEIFADDKSALRSFLTDLCAEAGRLESQIAKACREHDWARAARQSHELKGVCANSGCDEAATTAAALEVIVTNGPYDAVSLHVDRLRSVIERLRGAIGVALDARPSL